MTGTETLTAVLFAVVVLITVAITFWASRQNAGTTDYYAGGRQFSGFQNGMAISGDYMSAASFLGISGAIAHGVAWGETSTKPTGCCTRKSPNVAPIRIWTSAPTCTARSSPARSSTSSGRHGRSR